MILILTSMYRWVRYVLVAVGVSAGILITGILSVNAYILSLGKPIYSSIEDIPTMTVGVVLGGGMREDGTMTDFQTDRVVQASRLYHAGKIERILISGDDGALRDNEVDAMSTRMIAAGVNPDRIDIDRHGYRTYLTCLRAQQEFGIDTMVVITNEFHLPRTLYLCQGMGIDTIGLSADLRSSYEHSFRAHVREIFARVKALIQLKITKPIE